MSSQRAEGTYIDTSGTDWKHGLVWIEPEPFVPATDGCQDTALQRQCVREPGHELPHNDGKGTSWQPTPSRFDREAFYHRLDKERRRRRTSWRAIGRETGLGSGAFTLLGQGRGISIDALAALLGWLGETDLKPYLTTDPKETP